MGGASPPHSPEETVVVPQSLSLAVAAVTPLVTRYRDMSHAELEVRLGHTDPQTGAWVTGVSESAFNDILAMFLKYDKWHDMSDGWGDTHDYMYSVGAESVRTTSHLDTSLQLSHITKKRVGVVELELRGHGRARVALKTETPVCSKTLPETVNPHLVRLKKRRWFRHGVWIFDLTRVWRGATRSLAEDAQMAGATLYEIEVEFAPSYEYWDNTQHTSTYVATSMLMKMVDVLSSEMLACEVIS